MTHNNPLEKGIAIVGPGEDLRFLARMLDMPNLSVVEIIDDLDRKIKKEMETAIKITAPEMFIAPSEIKSGRERRRERRRNERRKK